MVEKGSGVLALAMILLGLLLIISAVRGTYVNVWKAFTNASTGNAAAGLGSAGGSAGGALGK